MPLLVTLLPVYCTAHSRRLKRTTPASRVSSTAMAAANGDASHGANGGIQIQSKEMKTAIHSNDSPKTLLKSESLHEVHIGF